MALQGGGGIGGGPWGGGPWGGAIQDLQGPSEPACDLLYFADCEFMPGVLGDPQVTIVSGQAAQFSITADPECDLVIFSGGPFVSDPDDTAALSGEPTAGVPDSWTLELQVRFADLPTDFSALQQRHIFFGAGDSTGPVAGIFLSQLGVAYTGSVSFSGAPALIQLDTPVSILPGTAGIVAPGDYYTIRIAVDSSPATSAVFLFITKTDDIPSFGHTLVAILPIIDASESVGPVTDGAIISVKGLDTERSEVSIDTWCLASGTDVPNLPPIADAGPDQAVRVCAIAQLDGSRSFDPEGAPLSYFWRLVDGPVPSVYVEAGGDGNTFPLAVPTGFTDKFHSATLEALNTVDPFEVGDVLLVNEITASIVSTGTDLNGFFLLLAQEILPDNLTGASFKLMRQRGINNRTSVRPTFFPDVPGFYKFELVVNDGQLSSLPSVTVVNAVESPLPRGITPNLVFMFSYLSDFWGLVEDRGRLAVYWSGMAQAAATELFTLWQIEYSKSLKDVQRTFNRRWLHYDLVLGEPVPELTKLRVLFSGVDSLIIPAAGVGGINGTSCVISSPVLEEPATITIVSADPVTATVLAMELQNRLRELHPDFATTVITRTDLDQVVRITAPFPFTIDSSTLPVFTDGQTSGLFSGAGGEKTSARSYKVGNSLLGLGITENDFLVLGGQAFRIAAIGSDPTDEMPGQRVNVKPDLPETVPEEWSVSGYVTSELLDFYRGLVSDGDDVSFEVVDVAGIEAPKVAINLLVQVKALGASFGAPGALPCDFTPLGPWLERDDVVIRLVRVVRRTYLPVDPLVVDIPTLSEFIEMVDDEAVLRRNVDFFIEEFRGTNALRFVAGAGGGPDVWEGLVPPDRLWAEYTYLDNNPTIEANFGIAAEFTLDQLAELPGNVDYLSAVRGLWYAYFNGPTLYNLRVGSQILLGLPFAEQAGTIEEIRTDFSPTTGRILVRDAERTEIVRSYSFPSALELEVNPATGQPYAVGDAVTQFSPLVQGVEIVDWVKDPRWFEGLLNQGSFYEVEKYHKFLVRVDEAAFNLAALLFTRSFILKIKPTYTYPLFLVTVRPDDTDVDVTDEIHFDVTLQLDDQPCQAFSSTIYDDARPGGGGFWNQFDNQQGTSLPTFPVPDDPVDWGYDKYILCPGDSVSLTVCDEFVAPALAETNAAFNDGEPILQELTTRDVGPFAVPTGGVGIALTPYSGGTTVALTPSTLTSVRLTIVGGPGADPDDYELVVSVNAVDTVFQPFTSEPGVTEVVVSPAVALVAGDVLGVRIRHGGGLVRNPAWTDVWSSLIVTGPNWQTGVVLPAAVYCSTLVTVP